MRRTIILFIILIGLISLLTVSAIHFLSNPRTNSIVSGKAVLPNKTMPKFYTYENSIYGISIDYPSVWEKVEFGKDNLIASFFLHLKMNQVYLKMLYSRLSVCLTTIGRP